MKFAKVNSREIYKLLQKARFAKSFNKEFSLTNFLDNEGDLLLSSIQRS